MPVLFSSVVEEFGDVVGGVAIRAGYAVSVDVQGGGRSGVAESLGDCDDGDPVGEHFGGHEMTQVVQPELAHSGTAAMIDEHLGDTIRCHGTEPSGSALNTNALSVNTWECWEARW